jgi:flagellar L-ring protein precursor FlgH
MMIISATVFAQDFAENASRSIFSDYKACKVGDAITIIVVESSQATNQAQLESGRDGEIDLGASASMGGEPMLPEVRGNISTGNDFKGGGKITSGGSFKTKISALVDSVYPNGLLKIKGSRKIVVNGEEQNIEISGLVRPIDINTDNTVYSYNISEAEIVLEGSGMIDRNTTPGFLTIFFHWLF